MPIPQTAIIATALPWKDVVDIAPKLVEFAKKLFSRRKEKIEGISSEERIQKLEENEKEQAELVEKITEQQISLIVKIKSMRKWLIAFISISIINLIGLVIVLIF